MDSHQEHLEPYRQMAREIRSVPSALKPNNYREDLQPYQYMVREIQSGKGAIEVQSPAWPSPETTLSPLTFSAADKMLVQERKENTQQLQVPEQELEVFQQRTTVLEACLVASRVEKIQHLEQELSQLRGQVAQRVQENWERAERLTQLQRELTETQQQEIAAQAQQQLEVATQLQVQLEAQPHEHRDSAAPEMPPNPAEAQERQGTQRQLESLKDITTQGSFPMIVMLVALTVIAFGALKLAVAVGLRVYTLLTAGSRVWKSRLQVGIPQAKSSKWTWWTEGLMRRTALQRG